jgi:ribulose-phosphate 3-epimerase
VTRRTEIAPSILAADFARLGEEIAAVAPYAGRIHVDVMDGHFVRNLTMGPDVVRCIRPVTALPIEVHLMVEEPLIFAEAFAQAGADRLIFHVEVAADPLKFVAGIKSAGVTAGIALKPETPWDRAGPYLGEVDLVTLMTVAPGFAGQRFIESVLPKVREAARSAEGLGLDFDIEVDGGVDLTTAALAKEAGANVFVAANSIFGSPDPADAARALSEAVQT